MGFKPIFLFWVMDLRTLLETTLHGMGYELVDLELPGRSGLLRVFIDKPGKDGGIDIDDCEIVSFQLSRLLEVENVDYERLEISSPGLDRPLRKAADFERFQGARITARLRLPLAGRRNFHGTLTAFVQGRLILTLPPDEVNAEGVPGGTVELALEDLEKARLDPDFGSKPGRKQSPAGKKPAKKPAKRK
ncbi:MAG: ribosome maturation factor RimP [Zoogloeaceae bacterium]|jgi:ribosome maturation factor RimP|nr:ribosome maturation factor RimP [Zoogloeaceae bacterium]